MRIHKIYQSSIGWGFCALCFMIMAGCALQKAPKTPYPSSYGNIDDVQYDNGYPKEKQPWVVFSDRSKNKISPSFKDNPYVDYKEAAFLEPYIVLKHRRGMLKIAEHKPDLINDGKLPKNKKLKILGWIAQERLQLWSNSLKNSKTGFASKAAIVINDKDIINHSEKYIENNTAIIFSAPDLIEKTKTKIETGSIVYIYKQSEDKNSFLIGKTPTVASDSIKGNIYGWVSKNMLSVWGERAGVKIAQNDSLQATIEVTAQKKDTTAMRYKELRQRTGMEGIYPLQGNDSISLSTSKKVKFFTNVFDYRKNKVYNVLGNPLYYDRYKEIVSDNRKLNVIFVLDVSSNNRLYIPVAKSLLQELQLNFASPSYFSSVKFGGVAYKQNNCGVSPMYSPLSSNYSDVTHFFEEKTAKLTCGDAGIEQPVDKGLLTATKMLSGAEKETNIIILIGTTAEQSSEIQSTINALTRTGAKLIFFQTQSKSADAYNDFVLLAQKLVVSSAENIAERKKEKIVSQNDLLVNENYNLTAGETGIYSLDFPKASMTQGFVIFPKKGETMPAGVLKTAIDSLLVQAAKDNKQIDNSLTKYFRSEIGVSNTKVKSPYTSQFPLTAAFVPTPIASTLLAQDTSFLLNGKIKEQIKDSLGAATEYGMLLNEQEYDHLNSFYTQVYKEVLYKNKFSKRKMLRAYLGVITKANPSLERIKRRKLKKRPVNELVQLSTGFPLVKDSVMGQSPKQWIKDKNIAEKTILEYFVQFKTTVKKLGTAKTESAVRIPYKGQVFYWLSKEYIPILDRCLEQ